MATEALPGAMPGAAPAAPRAPRAPLRTLRMRLTVLYGGVLVVSGAALLAVINALLAGTGSVSRTAPVPDIGQFAPGQLPHAIAIRQQGADLRALLIISLIALVGWVFVSFVLGWLIAGRVLLPLRTIVTTAREISASNLHARLALRAPYEEFRELGETLDDLFGRLEASFESQRHFVANASHELRTPITAERALIQVTLADPDASEETYRTTYQELLALSDQQERLIEALLTLASGEGGVEQWRSFDLARIAERVVLARGVEAQQRGIEIVTRLGWAPAAGDPQLVESLIANLVDNALRHNSAGGRVELTTMTQDGRASISVGNTGPVIPPADVDRLLQPFQRLDHARTGHHDGHGHGLGLAIVSAIARSHGATLALRPRAAGGLDVVVTFLTAPPSGSRT